MNCSDSASSEEFGGGAVWIGDTGPNLISDCQFSNCSTNEKGGAILFSDDGESFPFLSSFVKFCFFDNNTAAVDGQDVGILKNWIQLLTQGSFVECRTMTNRTQRVMYGSNDESGWIKLGFFDKFYVNSVDGLDHYACGLNQRKCKSISFVTNVIDPDKSSQTNISVDPSSYIESNCNFGTRNIELTNSGSAKVTIISSISSGSLFSVSTGSLKVSSFDFVHNTTKSSTETSLFSLTSHGSLQLRMCSISADSAHSEQEPLKESLFILSAGNTMIDSTVITGFHFFSKAAITFTDSCEISLANSSISGISRKTGNGGGIEGVVGAGKSLVVEGGELSECSSECGNGGGIALRMQAESSFRMEKPENETAGSSLVSCSSHMSGGNGGLGGGVYLYAEDNSVPDIAFMKTVFSDCSAENGQNIFVNCHDLSLTIQKEKIKIVNGISDSAQLEGYERSTTNETFPIPLDTYLRVFTSPAFIAGADGHDYTACGFSDYPCSTIEYAVSLRFRNEKRQICLLQPFLLDRALVVDTQPSDFTAMPEKSQIKIAQDIRDARENIIQTKTDCSFQSICFSLPSSFLNSISAVFHCCDKNLSLEKCSFASDSNAIDVSLATASKGCINIRNMVLTGLCFSSRSALAIEGDESRCMCENLIWADIAVQSSSPAIKVSDGSALEICNSEISELNIGSSSFIGLKESTTISIMSTSFKSVKKQTGNGGVMHGIIGAGKSSTLWNCTVDQCLCTDANFVAGGAIHAEVKSAGSFVLSNNTLKGCCVHKDTGVGGAVYLKLPEVGVAYSMKQLFFLDNQASLGNDVYLICPNPRDIITSQRWEGSAKEDEDNKYKWVVDSEDNPLTNVSILYYLFPPKISTVFIKNGGSSNAMCGDDLEPCGDLMFGFRKMRSDQTAINILDSCSLNDVLDRNGLSLTVRGISSTSRSSFAIDANGGFSLKTEIHSASLMLSYLRFNLSQESSVGQMISIQGGSLFVDDCLIGGESGTNTSTNMCIIRGNKGVIQLTKTEIAHLSFSGDGGIISVSEGSVHIENSDWSFAEANKPLLNVASCTNVIMAGNCAFDSCKSRAAEGGFAKCSLHPAGMLRFGNTSITNSGIADCTGRGGGVFLSLPEGANNDFLFENITFRSNSAECGKDLFLICDNLNASVSPSKFLISLVTDDGQRSADLMGCDRSCFKDSNHDLYLFLIQFQSQSIIISSAGFDMIGCGSERYPCCSFARGFQNILSDEQQKKITIVDGASVDHSYDLSSFEVASSDPLNGCSLTINPNSSDGRVDDVICSHEALSFESICFSLPLSFISGQLGLLQSAPSPDKGLTIENCTFSFFSSLSSLDSACQYYLIRSAGGFVHLSLCTFDPRSFKDVPLIIRSDFSADKCNFTGGKASGRSRGGVVACYVSTHFSLSFQECELEYCGCSETHGRGGFLFADCSSSNEPQPFSFKNVIFRGNSAYLGKSLFIAARELNGSVTSTTFNFNFSSLADDPNEFVGSDPLNENTDLFRFLIGYSSNTIFISSKGMDVTRCGNEDDPCSTFWKGMNQINQSSAQKQIFIDNTSFVQNMFDLSNYSVASTHCVSDEPTKAKLVLKKPGVDNFANGLFSNSWSLSFLQIDIFLDVTLDDVDGFVICSKNGQLSLARCSLSSDVSVRFQSLIFIEMQSGPLLISNFEVLQLTFELELISIWSGSPCVLSKCILSNMVTDKGFIRRIDGHLPERNEVPTITISASTFQKVSSSLNGACILQCSSISPSAMQINGSTFDMCRSESSENGGAMLFMLGIGGRFEVNNSRITNCECSLSNGKGGGVYLKTEGQGSLGFVFKNDEFKGNSAWKGRDIFVECWSIESQINEAQFLLDLRPDVFNRFDAIFGCDNQNHNPVDLTDYVTVYQQSTIVVSSLQERNGSNGRQCGKVDQPCLTVGRGLEHLVIDFAARLLIGGLGEIDNECNITNTEIKSLSREKANITFRSALSMTRQCVISAENEASIESVRFILPLTFPSSHEILFSVVDGRASLVSSEFCSESDSGSNAPVLVSATNCELILEEMKIQNLNCPRTIKCEDGNIMIHRLELDFVCSSKSMLLVKKSNGSIEKLGVSNCIMNGGSFVELVNLSPMESSTKMESFSFKDITFANVSSLTPASCIDCCAPECKLSLSNCTLSCCPSNAAEVGSLSAFSCCDKLIVESCLFQGSINDENAYDPQNGNSQLEICNWNGSLVHFDNCLAIVNDTTVEQSPFGGISCSGGSVSVADGRFCNNNPSIPQYPSARRNIICSNAGALTILSLKGGDGLLPNTSMWILNNGCNVSGIAEERSSPFFIPRLHSVKTNELKSDLTLSFTGSLLLPCNLSFQITSKAGNVEYVQKHHFSDKGFLSESEVQGFVSLSVFNEAPSDTDLFVSILYGNLDRLSSTESIVIKNKSTFNEHESLTNKGTNTISTFPLIIIIVFLLLFFIVLLGLIVFVVRWRKAKRRTEELEEIVNDTVKKDPKAFEMVTMEMSPEEQWRREEREAEKKNEERIKKRVYEKSLEHSESSEHLLSESGSTEYILGKDSDKIPEWVLEKVEEEDIRKQTPSPSISSTSTTDSDSTFVRGEDLCPTTSSMSNLVDAMACSSPHEKLIVDLRDSLFMLLHGKNEKKEMPIETLQEREQTTAQILFWVANLALHSLDEMENPLQSLVNLSPHVVLFSEHMVICIVMHSDLLSSDDSDSSSISSSTVVTSATNDDDDDDSLPSSAFEDESLFKKECMRWKAPELLINTKLGATKKSVAFSVGMILWECLTLKIPFGEYDAEAAGQKIANGERPNLHWMENSCLAELAKKCLAQLPADRPSLFNLKKELYQRFPPGVMIVTASDAIDYVEDTNGYFYDSGDSTC
ncbi:uncharacterized protein MONOS_14355 [Monocercomonoides exilis]|uniref:uncharacterized protein n=1 Tax=Monocercomonoides exilis TaxID=2049356 RepID=UPI0035596652|nr:hypothetical protein MONOS_14355 [Monocercomonoides exilis]|eukprot:MONOS_14355.1-p1 / transcript=MONOS_14355.1 / gene=MONOS_14355 / organism=Monocercomonoides_exilis_PA203 / gene_product=unspecified product / transcript_product=unspecified product / location=Mono_scaffold00987:7141-15884(-) / protein_length=2863 / sequence_SO=supercontig / SO=protein_coding / is_pseudo=false